MIRVLFKDGDRICFNMSDRGAEMDIVRRFDLGVPEGAFLHASGIGKYPVSTIERIEFVDAKYVVPELIGEAEYARDMELKRQKAEREARGRSDRGPRGGPRGGLTEEEVIEILRRKGIYR